MLRIHFYKKLNPIINEIEQSKKNFNKIEKLFRRKLIYVDFQKPFLKFEIISVLSKRNNVI